MYIERRSRIDFEDSQGVEGKRILNKKAHLRCRGTKGSYSDLPLIIFIESRSSIVHRTSTDPTQH